MNLRELQCAFSDAVFTGDGAGFAGHVREGQLSGEQRLRVYRNNLLAGFTEALGSVYPVVRRLVGDGFFRYACARFIPTHPSRSGDLHDYGADFGEFLAAFEPAAGLPYLPDVARLEWAYHRVYHAPGHPPLALDALAAVPPERQAGLRFTLHPACRLLASDYPVLRIWEVNQEDGGGSVELAEGGVRLLVRRPGLDVEIRPLAAAEHIVLCDLRRGFTLARAWENAGRCEPDADLAAIFQRHVLEGTLVGFSHGDR